MNLKRQVRLPTKVWRVSPDAKQSLIPQDPKSFSSGMVDSGVSNRRAILVNTTLLCTSKKRERFENNEEEIKIPFVFEYIQFS